MILTNEITVPVKHTESTDINENYLQQFSELTPSTDDSSSSSSPSSLSTQFDEQTINTLIESATDAISEPTNLMNQIDVVLTN